MRSAMRFVIISWFLAALVPAAQPAAARALTIEQAVGEALQTNQDYLIVKGEQERADAEVQRATADAFPHLSFGSSYTRNLKVPEAVFGGMKFKIGTDNTLDLGLTLTQSLWEGGKVLNAIKIARIYHKYVDELVRESESQITFGVREAFLNAILAQNAVQVYKDALATAEWNQGMITKMREQGVVSEYEKLRADVEVANLRPQLLQAENQAILALNVLRNMISSGGAEPLELSYGFDSTLVGQSLNFDQLLKVAVERRAALIQQDYVRQMSKRAVGIAKSEQSLKLDFMSRYGWSYQADDFSLDSKFWSPSWTATFTLSYPIFNGFSTRAAVRKARVDHRQAELSYEKLLEQVELETRDAFLRYNETAERLRTQRETIAQAEEGLRIARIRYQNGVGTQLEVLSSEAALTLAKTNFIQAEHDAALAVYRLLRATGVTRFAELKEQ